MKLSIIIPTWPQDPRPFGLDYIDKLNWPSDQMEVIITRGLQPCRQRNEAAHQAHGDILVFFDDDSCPEPDCLKRMVHHYHDPAVAAVGGPNPAVPTGKFLPVLVDAVFTSPLGVFSKRARYTPLPGGPCPPFSLLRFS